MALPAQQIHALEAFLERIKGETYPESPSLEHSEISARMIDLLVERKILAPGMRVLDVGCGQGVALKRFTALGCKSSGITLNAVDVAECVKKGYDVREMDQSFLDFPANSFDVIWCRHCLEHSIFPYFTLQGFFRVLKPGGWLYVEVPAPDTVCQHQSNQNHYSVLGKSMWVQLLRRTGFPTLEAFDIDFRSPAGPDTYWAFIQKKP